MIPLSTMEANSLLELNLSFNFLTDLGFFKEAYFPSLLTLNLSSFYFDLRTQSDRKTGRAGGK